MGSNSEIQYSKVGSKKDIEGFKNFVSKGDLTQGGDNYESRENQLPDIHKCK